MCWKLQNPKHLTGPQYFSSFGSSPLDTTLKLQVVGGEGSLCHIGGPLHSSGPPLPPHSGALVIFFSPIPCCVNTNSICNVLTLSRCQECARCYLWKITCPLDLLYKLGRTLTWKEEASICGKFIILNILLFLMFLEDEMWFPLVHDYKVENLELFEDNLSSTPFLNYIEKKLE